MMKKGGRPKRKMRRGGRTRRKKNAGGYLHGPSHEHGGIAANVGGNTPIELEGGEYIVNAETVSAVGTEFLDQLNSTQTSYHTGGFQQGQLPSPSNYRRGGRVRRKFQAGGMNNNCPPGQHWMPPVNGQPGYCMQGETHPGGGYRKGGKTNNNGRNKMARRVRRGGPARGRAMRRGGRPMARKTAMRRGGRPLARPAMRSGGRSAAVRGRRMQSGGRVNNVSRRGGNHTIHAQNKVWQCPSPFMTKDCVSYKKIDTWGKRVY